MTHSKLLRERQIWIATVAILGTGTVWLAVINAALLIRTMGVDLTDYFVKARLLARTLATVLSLAGPIVGAAAVVALVIGWMVVSGWREAGQEGANRAA